MTKLSEESILKTLAYADVFEWPLSKNEVFAKAQSSKLKAQSLTQSLKKLITNKKIGFNKGYYFLAGRESLVQRRIQREKWAREKFRIARKAAYQLKIIPSILLVGVSGGLVVGNAGKNDDIDFFIICRTGSLWTTRFLTTLLLDLLGKRRRPKDKNFKDKICLNMFVDEQGMAVPRSEQDLYMAHEVAQMKPLWDRGIYRNFLESNNWVFGYLRNLKFKTQSSKPSVKRKTFNFTLGFAFYTLRFALFFCEPFLSFIQKKYMTPKRTTEKIEPHRLMFHPDDKREWVMGEYKSKLKKLGLDY